MTTSKDSYLSDSWASRYMLFWFKT